MAGLSKFVIKFGKRLCKNVKYLNTKVSVDNIDTLGIQIRGEVRHNHRTVVDMILNKDLLRSDYKSRIIRTHYTTVEETLGAISSEKWYLLCYDFCPWTLQLEGVDDLRDAHFFIILRTKSNKIDCRFVVDRQWMDDLAEFEQLKYFVLSYELYSVIYNNTTKDFTTRTWRKNSLRC